MFPPTLPAKIPSRRIVALVALELTTKLVFCFSSLKNSTSFLSLATILTEGLYLFAILKVVLASLCFPW